MGNLILNALQEKQRQKQKTMALLIDPDKVSDDECYHLAKYADELAIDLILVGGSILTRGALEASLQQVKRATHKPTVIFPGNNMHISPLADGILLLSLVSGRNPEYLIGQHVAAAFPLKKSGLQLLPTAYLLIDGGNTTAVHYLSATIPLPRNKPEITAATALAAEMLGMQMTYLDAGSGAAECVPPLTVSAVRETTENFLIVGGGITTEVQANAAYEAGADMLVIGTAVEEDISKLSRLVAVRDKYKN